MNAIKKFFDPSDLIEHEVLRPLSHIRANWDPYICHNTGRYMDEEDSFAWLFNHLIDDLAKTKPPAKYHNSEDQLAEYVKANLNWKIRKQGNMWVNSDGTRLHRSSYLSLLEQGGFKRNGDADLVEAAAGRINAAISRKQNHFDDMEPSHQVILAGALSIILYHRADHEESYRNLAAMDNASNKNDSGSP